MAASSSSAPPSSPATTDTTTRPEKNTSCTSGPPAAASHDESSSAASLDPVPLPTKYRLHYLKEFGVAALCLQFDPLLYLLHVYSSENERWTTIQLPNPCPEIDRVITSKVVTIGEALIAWVDFKHGMLMINLHESNPSARYLPLPDPLPKNLGILNEFGSGPSARRFRDLACIGGVLRLVEMEHHVRVVTETPPVPREKDKLYDSDLITMSRKRKRKHGEVKPMSVDDGWKAVTWSLTVSSGYWEVGQVFDASDVKLDGPMCSSLLRGLNGETTVAADDDKMVFKDLYSGFPTLSAEGDDVLYLRSMTKVQ